ncbi:ABC transporter permease [Cellulomonas sp. P22]|uniref:ABC transporter permease n=1 Tax=Cellulomonas sp. P22 TaxID=3373189 RepID=UPI0037B4859C
MSALRQVGAGLRLQLAISRRSPAQFLVLVTAPLFTVIFLSLAVHYDNPDQVTNAVIGPGLIGLWAISLDVASSILAEDRWYGRLELLVGAPGSLELVVAGRIVAVALAGSLAFLESWLVATWGFGLRIHIAQPGVAVAALVATTVATACTATMLAALFMVSRTVHVFQNSMSYPVYILGGVVVPVSALPGWLGPVSDVIFLSWSADLLRDAVDGVAGDVGWRLLAILGLGGAALGAATLLMRAVQDRLRRTATAAFG